MSLRYLRNCKAILDLSNQNGIGWDIFISAYNDAQRVRSIFERVHANQKYWLALPEYHYESSELPTNGTVIQFSGTSEAEVINELFEKHVSLSTQKGGSLCIDMTGFMRPHILYVCYYLKQAGISSFQMIYTEPEQYRLKENTKFAGNVLSVRQVAGFEGIHTDDVLNDILIVGIGYDDELIARLIDNKDSAKVIQLFSLPSLSADMYQESILRLERTSLSIDTAMEEQAFFAPANDPFVVASELSDHLARLRAHGAVNNIYLSPLATKPQALGFALFYLAELVGKPASILFPFSGAYERETSKGMGRTWIYDVSF